MWKIISSYTRAEAIADGIQVKISPKVTKETGIHFLVAKEKEANLSIRLF